MKKNAFTLIEFLAVIVILAIIALIATPIILGIIKDAKENANKRSAENYIDAVEQAIVRENMKSIFRPTECDIDGGKVTCEGKELKVEVEGEVPNNGTIYLSNGSVSNGTILNFDGYTKKINNLAKENVKVSTETTKTTGEIPTTDEKGNIKIGSEFKIKVNDNSEWLPFFVLSNDGDYVNLIAEQNITPDGKFTSELQDGDEWYVTNADSYDNRYGPQTAYTYLSNATSNWINIPIIESFYYEDEGQKENSTYGYQSIKIELDEATWRYKTIITPYSSSYGNPKTYEKMRVRLPKYSEVTATEIGCTLSNRCSLWMVNYLRISDIYTSNEKKDSRGNNYGYWLLSSYPGYFNIARYVYCNGYIEDTATNFTTQGFRPVITILKSDLLRVMQ